MTTDSTSQTPDIIFYTRAGCTLCDKLWPHVVKHAHRHNLTLQSIDIDTSDELQAAHGNWVPVISFGGRVRLRGLVSPTWLAREFEAYATIKRDPHRAPPPKRIRVGVAILVDQANRILVNKRPEGTYFGGWWEWPGGKCEMGEHPLNGTIRELDEEIGIRGSHWQLFDRRQVEYPCRLVDLWFYLGERDMGSTAHMNALEHAWLAPKDVLKLKFLEPNLPVLHALIADPRFA